MLAYGFIITMLSILRAVVVVLGSAVNFVAIMPAAAMQSAAITSSAQIAQFQGVLPQTMASIFLSINTIILVLVASMAWKAVKFIRGA